MIGVIKQVSCDVKVMSDDKYSIDSAGGIWDVGTTYWGSSAGLVNNEQNFKNRDSLLT